MATADRKKSPNSLNVRSQKDWHTLCSEYNLCKRKLQAKKDALLILAEELDNVRQEKDAFRLMAEQLREKYQAIKKHYADRERDLGLSLNESDPLSEKRNHSLIQVLREARHQNKKADARICELEQKLSEAQGDIKLLRENIARQRVGDDGIGTRHFPAHEREELVNQLEGAREQLQALERDLVAKIDEQTELVTEKGYFKDKADRLNQELNYVLGGDEKRIVDIDALTMENKYLKERLKQAQEEKSIAQAAVNKYKAAIERRRGKNLIKLGTSSSGGLLVSPKQVEQLLADGKSGGIAATPSSVADLQSLATALLETIHDKNMAVNHHRNTNKILGNRVAELEKKLKTLEISGLWNLPPGRNAAFVASEVKNMMAGQSSLVPRQVSDVSDDSNLVGTESGPSLPSSLGSSQQSSPSHQLSSLGLDAGDASNLITLKQNFQGEMLEMSGSAKPSQVCGESLEPSTSTDDIRNWADIPVDRDTYTPIAVSVPSDQDESGDEPNESVSLLEPTVVDSQRPVSESKLDLENPTPDETHQNAELFVSYCADQEESHDDPSCSSPSNICSELSNDSRECLDTAEVLLQAVADKLSSQSREIVTPQEVCASSPGSSSPLLSRDKQVPNDKPVLPVDTAPHCV